MSEAAIVTPLDTPRIALVTGGASGIGLACAKRLAADGLTVAIADLPGESAAANAAAIGALFVPVDLTSEGACEHVVGHVSSALGALDVLVCSAGYQHIDPIAEFSAERWRHMLELMLTAPFLLTKHAWPWLIASGQGRIVHIGSAHSLTASPFKSAYVSAKHGLVGLARTTALEGGAHGLTCNVVAPGYVRTPLVEKQIADQARTRGIEPGEVEEKVFLENAAVKKLLEPEDVAGLVSYLVSEAAWGVTGSVQSIDMGWTAR
ncbi:MAG TPA: 3-hydroxybutyrate dehydrogenase [Trueperaceae bacterium]|nr:3-hydroxybutyrate dehydrogenase [Trueperaceae bacterium]